MKRASATTSRVLAIDPYSRGFGFVVLEGSSRLVDWGLRDTRRDKDHLLLRKVADLVRLYRPDVLVVEDCTDRRSRRRAEARRVISDIVTLAKASGLRTRAVSMAQVRQVFAVHGATTKHQIAGEIVVRFPELGAHRPRVRKPWMSEDERQAMFDAAALALTLFRSQR